MNHTTIKSRNESLRSLPAGPGPALDALRSQLVDHGTLLDGLVQTQAALVLEVQDLVARDRLLTDMNEQCRRYREQFYEREILAPVINGLINLADRCRREVQQFRRLACKRTRGAVAVALAQLLAMRQTDLVEIEAQLAALGVESFRHAGRQFDAAVQTCREPVVIHQREMQGIIAGRLLPGYRRGDRVVRREQVRVYVLNQPENGGSA